MTAFNNPNTDERQALRLPDTEGMDVAEAAAEWRLCGWHPVPLHPVTRVPYVSWRKGTELSPAETRSLFGRWPGCLVAIALPRGSVVLDIDHRPERAWDAILALSRLNDLYALPPCPLVSTPKAGIHVWLSLPPGSATRNWTSQAGRFPVEGVDIRTLGGLATVPPSKRSDGNYAWAQWMPDLPIAPPDLVRDLTPPAENQTEQKVAATLKCVSAYVAKAYAEEISAVAFQPAGGRNDQLFRSAAALGSFVGTGLLPEDHVHQSLIKAAFKCGLIQDDGTRAVQATIQSGLKAGKSNPRQIPERS